MAVAVVVRLSVQKALYTSQKYKSNSGDRFSALQGTCLARPGRDGRPRDRDRGLDIGESGQGSPNLVRRPPRAGQDVRDLLPREPPVEALPDETDQFWTECHLVPPLMLGLAASDSDATVRAPAQPAFGYVKPTRLLTTVHANNAESALSRLAR